MIAPKNTNLYIEIKYKGSKGAKVSFALAYLDSDKIPELIVYDPSAGFAIYRYKNKGVVRVGYQLYYAVPKGYYKKTGCLFIIERVPVIFAFDH